LDIHNKIPDLLLNNTDKNRTAPVAFTGKKIEIRLVGAAQNAAPSMIVLNTIVGQQLQRFADAVEREEKLAKHSSVAHNVPDAVTAITDEKSKALFTQANVFKEIELEARRDVILGRYNSELLIEARLMADMSVNHILPAAIRYQNELIINVKGIKELGMSKQHYATTSDLIATISEHINGLDKAAQTLLTTIENIEKETDTTKKAKDCHKQLKPLFTSIRTHADELEFYVDNGLWTLPKYRELLFLR